MDKKPKKKPAGHLTTLRAFRLQPADDAKIVKAAAKEGLAVSAWIREALLRAAAALK